ncbi:HhH-GPD superfamily base excision DNA repair protein [Phlyctema vagabunda]|uniref:HhH-GPD superfamily base excision DNA repair protein n=1 Tax=Phlyctema vagabunda TaxID=108571 RepID=A0ABR4PM93_9HELO
MATRRSTRIATVASSDTTKVKDEQITQEHKPAAAAVSRKRKMVNLAPPVPEALPADETPTTPRKKRVAKPIPFTPTPSVVALMSDPIHQPEQSTPPPIRHRLAAPNATNAPLISPETSRVITSKPLDEVSPSKVSNVKTTTDNILEEALAHLIKVEPKLKSVIEKNPCKVFSPEGLAETVDPFMALTSGIISQQVSGAAAKSIKAKFVALFNPDVEDVAQHVFPVPSAVAATTIEKLRTAGLSQRKAEYIQGLAEKFASGELSATMLFSATDEELLEELIKVRGLGKWSVEMFACFSLKRMDVFSTGDLGVQKGMASLAGRDVSKAKSSGKGKWKYMSEKEMEEIADKFRPYRSVFMWYTWRVADTDISTFDD